MIEITEYWNDEVRNTFRVNNTLHDIKSRVKRNPRMTIQADQIVEDCGVKYGIHIRRIIKEEGKHCQLPPLLPKEIGR